MKDESKYQPLEIPELESLFPVSCSGLCFVEDCTQGGQGKHLAWVEHAFGVHGEGFGMVDLELMTDVSDGHFTVGCTQTGQGEHPGLGGQAFGVHALGGGQVDFGHGAGVEQLMATGVGHVIVGQVHWVLDCTVGQLMACVVGHDGCGQVQPALDGTSEISNVHKNLDNKILD